MNDARRPHAIHAMRRKSNRLSKVAIACGEAASEAAHLLGLSIAVGGDMHCMLKAQDILEGLIADMRLLSTEAAVAEYEPGHTRRDKSEPEQPTLVHSR